VLRKGCPTSCLWIGSTYICKYTRRTLFDAFVDFHQSLINSPAERAIHLGNLHQNAFRSVIYLADRGFGKTKQPSSQSVSLLLHHFFPKCAHISAGMCLINAASGRDRQRTSSLMMDYCLLNAYTILSTCTYTQYPP